jgi:16S rRNA processing protein RimM
MPPDEVFLAVGRIVGGHGIQGEVKMAVLTDRPEILPGLRRVYFNDDPTPVSLGSMRFHGKMLLLTFPFIKDRDAADALRGTVIRVSASQLPPPPNETFYHYQILGLETFDQEGVSLGVVAEIIEAGEVDVYVVRDEAGKEHLFPALKDVVLEIDPPNRRMVVQPQVWED